jgi:hypothetical protein
MEVYDESKGIRKTNVREMQDHQAERQGDDYLRKPEA